MHREIRSKLRQPIVNGRFHGHMTSNSILKTTLKLRWRLLYAFVGVILFVLLVIRGVKLSIRQYKCHKNSRKGNVDEYGFQTPRAPFQTAYVKVEHIARPVDRCAKYVGFDQVSLLYLSKGLLLHEHMWHSWFMKAVGKIPIKNSKIEGLCGSHKGFLDIDESRVITLCDAAPVSVGEFDRDVIHKQHIFDVWVHVPILVDEESFQNSIFRDRLLPSSHRVPAEWGSHSLIDATRALFAAALTNPLAQKLVLVSDSDAPLYCPLSLYTQLSLETKSRINACNTTKGWNPNDGARYREDMRLAGLHKAFWRKSWQWIALTRRHATIVVDDVVVDRVFRDLCRPRWDRSWCDFRVCYSDEHYIPTLLATHGLDNETDCRGELTDRDWSRVKPTDPHPYTYSPDEVSVQLLEGLRHSERPGCKNAGKHQFMSRKNFISGDDLQSEHVCNVPPATLELLGAHCPLLARKFPRESAADLVEATVKLYGH